MTEMFDCTDPAQREAGIASAISALKGGRLVVMPTDTVYGIGADAFDKDAVAALLSAKGRGRDMPVPVLVGSWHTIQGLVYSVPQSARELPASARVVVGLEHLLFLVGLRGADDPETNHRIRRDEDRSLPRALPQFEERIAEGGEAGIET